MCGIFGIIDFTLSADYDSLCHGMTSKLKHRGPDADGFYKHNNVFLGHRRLSIIDIDDGSQPMTDTDGHVVIVYNGEVYNYKELRSVLSQEYTFRTKSDTEVVLYAYKKWGTSCLEKFEGMFSFCIYDKRNNNIFIARDRVGIKPLYYAITGKHFVFSSELSSVVESGLVKKNIDKDSVKGFFQYQYVPTPKTIYEDVFKLEPGFYFSIDLNTAKIEKKQYWALSVNSPLQNKTEKELVETFDELFSDVIGKYIRSDAPFGAFLSGGVDSSLVSGYMQKVLGGSLKTYAIGYKEEKYSELSYAKQASSSIKSKHKSQVVDVLDAVDDIENLMNNFGEPFGDSSLLPTYLVSKMAANDVKMVLSGDGGDELFGGYNSYRRLYNHIYRTGGDRSLDVISKMHYQHRYMFGSEDIERLFGDRYIDKPWFDVPFAQADDPMRYYQFSDFRTYLVDDVLTKVDRMSMANSLEVRVPLLDHRVVEFAYSLPLDCCYRVRDGRLSMKYLLIRAAEKFYPQDFFDRKKMGFGIPIFEWMQGGLKTLVCDYIKASDNLLFDFVARDYVLSMLDAFYVKRDASLTSKIWMLFSFSLWAKNVYR